MSSRCLVPTLSEGDVVVMDNLPAHKAAGVRDAIETAGASLLYLPPYSPDFNPIENAFAKTQGAVARQGRENHHSLCGTPSARSSTSSPQPNVQTTSRPQGMNEIKPDVL